ncbi:MAG: hypothetical protein AAFX78_10255 [Cyanobacteria bacterium J06638_20]
MHPAIALALLTLLIGTALVLLLRFQVMRIRRRLMRKIGMRFPEAEILKLDLSANLFGVRSRGHKQIRGTGGLVLTHQYLYFLRAVPEKEFAVPLQTIQQIDHPQQFLGKSIFYPLLRVTYTLDGKEEEITWAVRQPEAWKAAIAQVLS